MIRTFYGNIDHRDALHAKRDSTIPLGTYEIAFTRAGKVKKASGAIMLELEGEILEGEHQGQRFSVQENLWSRKGHLNPVGLSFLYTLHDMTCTFVQGITPGPLDELCNVPLRAEIVLEIDNHFGPRNKLRNMEQLVLKFDPEDEDEPWVRKEMGDEAHP